MDRFTGATPARGAAQVLARAMGRPRFSSKGMMMQDDAKKVNNPFSSLVDSCDAGFEVKELEDFYQYVPRLYDLPLLSIPPFERFTYWLLDPLHLILTFLLVMLVGGLVIYYLVERWM